MILVSNSFAYKFPNFHPLFFRSIGWKFQGSNLPVYLFLLSLSPFLSLTPLQCDGNFKIRISKFPSLFFIFTLSFFARSNGSFKVRICLQISDISFSFLTLFLSLSLPARLDENSKIRIHPNFQISKFPSPSIGRALVQARSAYEFPNLLLPFLLSSSIRPDLFFSSYSPLRSDSKVATRPGDPSAATRRALAELWTSGSEKGRDRDLGEAPSY